MTTQPVTHILTYVGLPPGFMMAFLKVHPCQSHVAYQLHVITWAHLIHFSGILAYPQNSAFVEKVHFFLAIFNLITKLYQKLTLLLRTLLLH